ncbi:hypothetical protein BZG36_03047 [Bifiguratus adelaidae]|uniref:Uncharacterized protein n=1 Tax=Bifiguratus adelaidae TaxID=1938954 RepID=A0A261XYY1_9FUNG|nr:hypothetical protein BZG36_03047 [Bifiguratus adelaidae]
MFMPQQPKLTDEEKAELRRRTMASVWNFATIIVTLRSSKKSTAKCPICKESLPQGKYDLHYQWEVARLDELYHEQGPSSKSAGKRSAAVSAAKAMGNHKRSMTGPEAVLDKVRANRSKRRSRLGDLESRKLSLGNPAAPTQQCPLCQHPLYGDDVEINLHIDKCLENGGQGSKIATEPTSGDISALSPEDDGGWDEYEWAGEMRVRATAFMEGGYGAAGFALSKKDATDIDDDVEVEGDDALEYGEPQFSERDLIRPQEEDENEDTAAYREMVYGESSTKSSPASSSRHKDKAIKSETHPSPDIAPNMQSKLIIESLKARIHELENETRSVPKCLKLWVKTLQQQRFALEVEPEETVGRGFRLAGPRVILQVKQKVEQSQGHAVASQKLIASGKILADEKTIADYGLSEKDFLVLMITKPKAAPAAAASSSAAPASSPSASVATVSAPSAAPAPAPAPVTPVGAGETTSTVAAPADDSTTASAAAPTTTSAPTEPDAGTGFGSAGALVTGAQYEAAVQNMMEMGFDRSEVVKAMRASFNNPDRAVEYLMTGIPEHLLQETQASPQPAGEQASQQTPVSPPSAGAGAAQQPAEGGDQPQNLFAAAIAAAQRQQQEQQQEGGNDLEFLRHEPQFQQLRQLVQANPGLLQPVLQQLSQSNPELLQRINQNQQQFLQLLNETDEGDEGMGGQEQYIQVTQEEKAAIDRTKTFTLTQTPEPTWTPGSAPSSHAEAETVAMDPLTMEPVNVYKLVIGGITPRPIAFVSSQDKDGNQNLAPFSYFNAAAHDPPTIMFSVANAGPDKLKDTAANIIETGEFTVNIINEWFLERANYTAIDAPHDKSEWTMSGLTKVPSQRVKPPRVAESSYQMECQLLHHYPLISDRHGKHTHTIIIGKVLLFHLHKDIVNLENSHIDMAKHRVVEVEWRTPIRADLRKGLYYQNYGKDPDLAVRYYQRALEEALTSDALEAHSAHVTGIMIQLGALLAEMKQTEQAIGVLEKAFDAIVTHTGTSIADVEEKRDPLTAPTVLDETERIKAIGLAQKLGDLYVLAGQDDKAEQYYVWSVEQLLKPQDKDSVITHSELPRSTFNFDQLPPWMTKTDLGASLEALAAFYSKRGQYSYALPLYLRALSLFPTPDASCHALVLMCNLSEVFAGMGNLEEAERWAQKGIEVTSNPNVGKTTGDRPECDESCGVMLFNLGMIKELSNDTQGAIAYYEKARQHGKAFKLPECVQQADKALKRVRFRTT